MKRETVEKLDALCTEWSKNTDEPFVACVVRHGVIVFHKAYGMRSGAPMTVDTPSRMASITKVMSALMMMELVSQGWVNLDDSVEKYLPPLRNLPMKTPITLRHCYTHTTGGWDHWGDEDSDLEERVVSVFPTLEVGARYEYSGLGYVLGGRIIENMSGESLPAFYQQHLLDPLDLSHTTVSGTYSGANSTALDMAKIGQVLANKGAYGNLRFISEEAFRLMLPERLTKVLGPETLSSWGIGTEPVAIAGLSAHTFTHGAASAATLIVDPEAELVISMTRNASGLNYKKYQPLFVKAVVDCMEK